MTFYSVLQSTFYHLIPRLCVKFTGLLYNIILRLKAKENKHAQIDVILTSYMYNSLSQNYRHVVHDHFYITRFFSTVSKHLAKLNSFVAFWQNPLLCAKSSSDEVETLQQDYMYIPIVISIKSRQKKIVSVVNLIKIWNQTVS